MDTVTIQAVTIRTLVHQLQEPLLNSIDWVVQTRMAMGMPTSMMNLITMQHSSKTLMAMAMGIMHQETTLTHVQQ
jgi:hypothetical protein